jgi:alginate O-acetyltransferase complex protein AlgI
MRLTEASKGFLVVSSLFFYSCWNIIYLPLILASMTFNYVIGTSLTKEGEPARISKKQLLITGIIGNLGLLGYFKYTDFFIANMNYILDSDSSLLNLALPLAISFFTFQQIAYLVDSYRCETKEYDFLNYAVFVTFFPQLIAGPIVHHKEMMPQFANSKHKVINYKNIALGLFIFSIGLFKKVVIADTFAVWATNGFDKAEILTFFDAWATSLSYTFQLYFDFSGYTDMAIGAALLFNIKLPINFNSPYKATNIQDFWRRWHITLSTFLKDYIYIPLGGNRQGNYKTYNNLFATFFIGGLWHGAGWTFVFWGALHGVAIVFNRIWNQLGFRLNYVVGWFITFNFVNIAWVFFRAKEWEDAINVLKGMLGVNGIEVSTSLVQFYNYTFKKISVLMPHLYGVQNKNLIFQFNTYFYISIGFILVLFFKNTNKSKEALHSNFIYIKIILLFVLSLVNIHYMNSDTFIYFNF